MKDFLVTVIGGLMAIGAVKLAIWIGNKITGKK